MSNKEKTKEEKQKEEKTQKKVIEQLSGDNNTKVEEVNRIIGDKGVHVTTKGGKQTEATISGENVETSGENASEVKRAAQSGGKVALDDKGQNSQIKQEAESSIRNSNLSDAEKEKLVREAGSKDLTKEDLNQFSAEVKEKVKNLEERKQEKEPKRPVPGEETIDKFTGQKPKDKENKSKNPVADAAKNFTKSLKSPDGR